MRLAPIRKGGSYITNSHLCILAVSHAMPSSPAKLTVVKAALSRERRTNRRLRALIEEVRAELAAGRADDDIQTKRIAQLQAEVDLLKARR